MSFLSFYNEKLIKKNLSPILPLYNSINPSLEDAWISGITDGEGCFTCSILSNSTGYRFRYILTQKWNANKYILEHISKLFKIYSVNSSVVPHSVENIWELRTNGIKNCKGLFNYFDKFNLITIKKDSYLKWKLIHSRLVNKDHLNDKFRLELIEQAKLINSNN